MELGRARPSCGNGAAPAEEELDAYDSFCEPGAELSQRLREETSLTFGGGGPRPVRLASFRPLAEPSSYLARTVVDEGSQVDFGPPEQDRLLAGLLGRAERGQQEQLAALAERLKQKEAELEALKGQRQEQQRGRDAAAAAAAAEHEVEQAAALQRAQRRVPELQAQVEALQASGASRAAQSSADVAAQLAEAQARILELEAEVRPRLPCVVMLLPPQGKDAGPQLLGLVSVAPQGA